MEIARQKNANPLPMIPEKFGVRLPPERYCLTGTNYKIKNRKREVSIHAQEDLRGGSTRRRDLTLLQQWFVLHVHEVAIG